jgi:hypothetical protein
MDAAHPYIKLHQRNFTRTVIRKKKKIFQAGVPQLSLEKKAAKAQ